MTEITTYNGNLPTTTDDLAKFILVGREKLTAVRAEIRAIDKVGLAKEVRAQKLAEAQDIAEAVLDAEVRMGELLKEIPKASGGDRKSENIKKCSGAPFETKSSEIQRIGIESTMAKRFEALASHPDLVAAAKAAAREQDDVVSRAAVLKTIKTETKREERAAVIQEKIESASESIDLYNPPCLYRVIYADPPWCYGDKQNFHALGGAEKHYPTMPTDEICALPIPAEEDAVLFLWVTSPMLEDGLAVIRSWGFKYKSSFVWDKVLHNMGHYNSVRHEFLLIATRGSCTPDNAKLFDSVQSIERTEHSVKPEEFRNMIDTLYTSGKKLEMFARVQKPGWDAWGNMV